MNLISSNKVVFTNLFDRVKQHSTIRSSKEDDWLNNRALSDNLFEFISNSASQLNPIQKTKNFRKINH
jgi:hypothetical protein